MVRMVQFCSLVVALLLIVACGATPATNTSSGATSAATVSVAATVQTPSGANQSATSDAAGSGLTVFAAASLTNAFGEIGKQFEAANNTKVLFNFAGSNQLSQQIAQGALVDVFASANRKEMDNVIKSGQVISGTQHTFVRNRLVVVYPKDNPAKLQQLSDLAKPGIKIVLAAKAVPVGTYALDFLRKASALPEYTQAYSQTVLANVVSYEENVRAVLSKITLGEADAGIVYTSDVSGDSSKVGRIEIPDTLNTIATYPIAPIKDSANAALAQKFVEYVLAPEG